MSAEVKENVQRMVVEVDQTEYRLLRSKLMREGKTITKWVKDKMKEELQLAE